MRMVTLLRAVTMASSLAAAIAMAPAAFAQSQYTDATGVTHYGYFSTGDQIRGGLTPVQQQNGPALAQSRSNIVSDVSGATIAGDPAPNLRPYNPENILTRGSTTW